MKKTQKFSFLVVAASLATILTGCNPTTNSQSGSSVYVGPQKTIVIDGGGDVGNFNTTASLTESEANPYPYNTLETLCKEWMSTHPQYIVKINKTSMNGDRGVLVPLLNQHKAPDITYQNGTVINTDLGKDYYIKLTDAFQTPNPYVEGNEHWIDIYSKEEVANTMASDGNFYTVCLEKIPVGIMYNQDLLNQAGVSSLPNSYGEYIAACEAIKKLGGDYQAYSTTYNWYNIALESNVYSGMIAQEDVLRKNGIIDQEEMVRAYAKGLWDPTKNALSGGTLEGNDYYDYIKLCTTLGKVKAPLSYSAHEGFVSGKLGFLEVTGREIRKLSANKSINFQWNVMPFPALSTSDYAKAGVPCVGGTAGLATSWFVTKAAEDKGTTEGCIDLLKFLTAPKQNNRMIGDLKGGIPLNPDNLDSIASYLKPLINVYNSDMLLADEGQRCYWAAFNSWGVLGYDYNTAFIKTLQDVDNGIKTAEDAAHYLAQVLKNTAAALRIENEWDETKW